MIEVRSEVHPSNHGIATGGICTVGTVPTRGAGMVGIAGIGTLERGVLEADAPGAVIAGGA